MRGADARETASQARRAQFAAPFSRFQQAYKAVDQSLRHFIREQCDEGKRHWSNASNRRARSTSSSGDVLSGRPHDFWEKIERARRQNASILSKYRRELGDAAAQ